MLASERLQHDASACFRLRRGCRSYGCILDTQFLEQGVEGCLKAAEAILDMAECGGAVKKILVESLCFVTCFIVNTPHVSVQGSGHLIKAMLEGGAGLADLAPRGLLEFTKVAEQILDRPLMGGAVRWFSSRRWQGKIGRERLHPAFMGGAKFLPDAVIERLRKGGSDLKGGDCAESVRRGEGWECDRHELQ